MTVGLIAPAGASGNREEVRYANDVLRSLGYRVKEGKHVYARTQYLAGTDRQRAEDVNAMFADPDVHGILVQLPLPEGLDPEPVLALVPPEKDVDGLTERSMGRLVRGLPGHVPCTPLGVMRLLERYEIEREELLFIDDVAGNVAGPTEVGSVEYAVEVAHVGVLVGCHAVRADRDTDCEALAGTALMD